MPTKQKSLIYLNLFLITTIVIFLIFKEIKSNNKIVFISNSKIFAGFNMTHDLKIKGDKEIDFRKKKIDGLYNQLNVVNGDAKELIMQQILTEKEKLSQFNDFFATQETTKIWQRIESYSKEYAQKKGYQFILGAQPNSNIIFGSENLDITNDFLIYINKKYEGN